MAKKQKKTTAEMKKIKNMVMESLRILVRTQARSPRKSARDRRICIRHFVLTHDLDHDTGGMNGRN